MTLQFRSLLTWPAKAGSLRAVIRLSGNRNYREIIQRLETELKELQASSVLIESGHDPDDLRLDGHIKEAAKPPRFPGMIVRLYAHIAPDAFSGNPAPLGALWFACKTYDTWQDNLWAIAMTLERLRAIVTYGTIPQSEIYALFADLSDEAVRPAPTKPAEPKRPRPTRPRQTPAEKGECAATTAAACVHQYG